MFLYCLIHMCRHAFHALHTACVPNNMKRFQECLCKTENWDRSIIESEIEDMASVMGNYAEYYKHTFIAFVKHMKGGNNVKIMINLPKFDVFSASFFKLMSKHAAMQNGLYFTYGPLDQAFVVMQVCRMNLETFMNVNHVKVEDKFKSPPAFPYFEDDIRPDDSISNVCRETSVTRASERSRAKPKGKEAGIEEDDNSVSSISLSQATQKQIQANATSKKRSQVSATSSQSSQKRPDQTSQVESFTQSVAESRDDNDSSIGIPYQFRTTKPDESRKVVKNKFETESDTSNLSISNTSENNNSTTVTPVKRQPSHGQKAKKEKKQFKKPIIPDIPEDEEEEEEEEASDEEDFTDDESQSEVSQQSSRIQQRPTKQKARGNQSPSRSYISSLTNTSRMTSER